MKRYLLLLFVTIKINITMGQAPTQWISQGIGGGGALFSPSINPDDVSDMYIGCDMGGLYHSLNQGETWQLQPFQQIRGGNYSKVNFTNNALIQYCISYKSGPLDIVTPAKTTDGGLNWNKLIGNPDDYERLYALYANYDKPSQVIISQYNKILFSNDGGTTFTIAYTGINTLGEGCKLSGVFWDGNNIYCGTSDGIVRSTDGGVSFNIWNTAGIPTGQALASFAGAKENGKIRFYIITANTADVYNGDDGFIYEYGKKIFMMDTLNGLWQNKTNNYNYTLQYGKQIKMAVNEIDTVYIGGYTSIENPMVLQSSNGGTTWNAIFKTANNENIATGYCGQNGDLGWSWAGILFGIDVCPKNASVLLISDLGFVHKTINGGKNWSQCYTKSSFSNAENIATPKFKSYKSAGDLNEISVWQNFWIDSNTIWQCASDIKGVITQDKGATWNYNYTGHTENTSYRMVKNIANNTLYMATSSIHDLYQSARLTDNILDAINNTGAVKMSTDNGLTWQTMHDFSNIVCWVSTDPNNANKLYASVVNSTDGNGGIWATNNANLGINSTWTKLPNPPRTEGHPFNIIVLNDGKVLASFSGRRAPAFTTSSGIFLYDPTTNNWTDKSDGSMQYWTQDIIVDATDTLQNTWYACVYDAWGNAAAMGVGGLYKTNNRGNTWSKIWSNARCMSATISPNNNNEIYVSTEIDGLYYCNNLNTSNPTFTQTNFPYRNLLRTFYNPYNNKELWVSTFGGGVFQSTQLNTLINTHKNEYRIAIYPNPACNYISILIDNNAQIFDNIEICNVTGQIVLSTKMNNRIDISKLNNGNYVLKLKGKNIEGSKAFTIIK
jgi:photosystem II stability/assembly factor-like uncharacterized protein